MKTESEVRKEFDALIVQRDSCTEGSAARKMLAQRILAIGWVIEHPKVESIRMDVNTLSFLDCLT